METLNQNRFHLVMKRLIHFGKISTPPVVNAMEPILSGMLWFCVCIVYLYAQEVYL